MGHIRNTPKRVSGTGWRRPSASPNAMPRDAFVLVFFSDHEPGDVLQEYQWHAPLAGQLDEVCALLRGLGEQDAVVREDGHRHAVDARETGDQRGAETRLPFIEVAAI